MRPHKLRDPDPRPGAPGSDPPSGVHRRLATTAAAEAAGGRDPFVKWLLQHPEELARELGVPVAHVDDILQDTLEAFCQSAATIEPALWYAWLLDTARKRRRRFYRFLNAGRAWEAELAAHLGDRQAGVVAPDMALRLTERRRALLWLVDHVKPSRREVARRKLLHGRSLSRIARELGAHIGTVRSRWDRAKDDMRAAVKREDAKHRPAPWLALIASLLSAWAWVAPRVRRRAGALLACAAFPLVLATHEGVDPDAPGRAHESERIEVVASTGGDDDARSGHDARPGDGAASGATPADPLQSESATGAAGRSSGVAPSASAAQRERSRTANESGPAEDILIRRATEAIATNPSRALTLLTEHRRRFPHGRNAALRDQLFHQARAALRATDPHSQPPRGAARE